MRMIWIGALLYSLAPLFVSAEVSQTSSSPATRTITDPHTIMSVTNPQARPVPIEDLYHTNDLGGAAWSPDGKRVVFVSNMSGTWNLWSVPASGGWPLQLTQSNERQFEPVFSPDGKWIVFQQDAGGNELWNLYAVPSRGGQVIRLTNAPNMAHELALWSHHGNTLALRAKARGSAVRNIELLDWSSHAVRAITTESTRNHSWVAVAWSPDDKTLYATRSKAGFVDSDVYAIDIASGQATNLTPHEGNVVFSATALSPDGSTLLLNSTQQNGNTNVALLRVRDRKITWATHTMWEAHATAFSPDGSTFAYNINADGMQATYVADTQTFAVRSLAVPPGMNSVTSTVNPFSPRGDQILVLHKSSIAPADYYVCGLHTRTSRRLTYSAVASLANTPLPIAQLVHYKSDDGMTISAFVWMPFNLKRDGSHPAIVMPHGLPNQTTDSWSPRIMALVSRGYICIAPNTRGSTGYGVEFQQAVRHDFGGGDLQDLVYASRFLQTTGYADPRRIGVTGASYGGYLALMAIGKTPGLWAAAVDEFGIANWETFVQHSDPAVRQSIESLLGDPIKDKDIYEKSSPVTYLSAVRAPLLILQGEEDTRVPKQEGEQVVATLTAEGKTVEAHFYPHEGHGFSSREDNIDSLRRTVQWFDKYMGPISGGRE